MVYQPCHTIVYTSNNRFSAKLVINTGQSGPLETISPEIFFWYYSRWVYSLPIQKYFLRYVKLSAIEKNGNVLLHNFACNTFANLVCQFWLVSGSKLISICFIFRSVIQWRPEKIINIIKRFMNSCSIMRETIKFSQNSV